MSQQNWIAGGSIPCHCIHIDALIMEMRTVKTDVGRLRAARMPLLPASQPPGYEQPGSDRAASCGTSTQSDNRGSSPLSLPLMLGSLGPLGTSRIFDDRKSTSEDFKFKTLKGRD